MESVSMPSLARARTECAGGRLLIMEINNLKRLPVIYFYVFHPLKQILLLVVCVIVASTDVLYFFSIFQKLILSR